MSLGVPSGYGPFVRRLIASGQYGTEEEVLAEGLKLLQAREQLRHEVKRGFDQLTQGDRIPASEVHSNLDALVDDMERGARQ